MSNDPRGQHGPQNVIYGDSRAGAFAIVGAHFDEHGREIWPGEHVSLAELDARRRDREREQIRMALKRIEIALAGLRKNRPLRTIARKR